MNYGDVHFPRLDMANNSAQHPVGSFPFTYSNNRCRTCMWSWLSSGRSILEWYDLNLREYIRDKLCYTVFFYVGWHRVAFVYINDNFGGICCSWTFMFDNNEGRFKKIEIRKHFLTNRNSFLLHLQKWHRQFRIRYSNCRLLKHVWTKG